MGCKKEMELKLKVPSLFAENNSPDGSVVVNKWP